jgi:DNA mismatch repair protein MutL
MSDIIKLLPEHVANQIAAGEVIQRPSSVVKELLDNAIDAKSTSITLLVRDGGKTLIQINDNGIGMSPMDARLCWERHATSKISKAEDIFQVKTMGFRGEALASIASVAMVDMKTKRTEDTTATQIQIEASQVKAQQLVAAPNGTSIAVKNLFFNIPARRNFLKSDAVELRHIIDEFIRSALAHPSIEMSMYHNDNEVYKLKSGDIVQRINQLFGHKAQTHYLQVKEETTIVHIEAYIGKPDIAKRTRGEQFIFVNNRFIKDPYLNHAVVNCYENLIAKEQFPFYLLYLTVNPSTIDINVHPTKTEIKFEDEKALYQIIRAVVKRAIGDAYHTPQYEPLGNESFVPGALQSSQVNTEHSSYSSYSVDSLGLNNKSSKPQSDWQELFAVLQKKTETIGDISKFDTQTSKEPTVPSLFQQADSNRSMIQLHGSIIITQVKSGMMLIDQQAAHERILYEKYLHALVNQPISSQQKLFPQTITLNTHDVELLQEVLPKVQVLGFDINALGKNTFVINGVPAELDHANAQELIEDLLDSFKKQQAGGNESNEKIAMVLARKAAIKAGTKISYDEMNVLIDELFACATPHQATDGRPCIKTLSLEQIFKLIHQYNI